MKNKTQLLNILNLVFYVFVGTVLLLVFASFVQLPFIGQYKMYGVASQSMSPTLKKGDLIFVTTKKDYKKGDVITFMNPKSTKKSDTVTHRIIGTMKKDKEIEFKTKGDANNVADDWSVPRRRIAGVVSFTIPLVGTIISLSRTTFGFIFIVIVPATLIVYTEIMNIKNEVMKMMQKKKEDEKNTG